MTARLLVLALLLSTVAAVASPSSASAQDRTRVYLRYAGDGAKHFANLSLAFEGPVLQEGAVEFAGTAEMDAVYAECRTQMGVAGTEERKCRLQAARRVFVEQMIEIDGKVGKKSVRVGISVWNTDDNSKVFAAMERVEDEDSEAAIERALDTLAKSYLCYRGVARRCADGHARVATAQPDSYDSDDDTFVAAGRPVADGVLISEQRISDDAREVTFEPHDEGGFWSLYMADGTPVCSLPCTRWVAPRSKTYVGGKDAFDDRKHRVEVPDELGFGPEVPLAATLDLDNDWQPWEVNALWMTAISGVVTFTGMGLLVSGFSDNSDAMTAVGGSLYGVGGVTLAIITPAYALYYWAKDDEIDNLLLEERRATKPIMVGATWTY